MHFFSSTEATDAGKPSLGWFAFSCWFQARLETEVILGKAKFLATIEAPPYCTDKCLQSGNSYFCGIRDL